MTGVELALKRRMLGYTQSELGVFICASRATVSRWETSEKELSPLLASYMEMLQPKRKEGPCMTLK